MEYSGADWLRDVPHSSSGMIIVSPRAFYLIEGLFKKRPSLFIEFGKVQVDHLNKMNKYITAFVGTIAIDDPRGNPR